MGYRLIQATKQLPGISKIEATADHELSIPACYVTIKNRSNLAFGLALLLYGHVIRALGKKDNKLF